MMQTRVIFVVFSRLAAALALFVALSLPGSAYAEPAPPAKTAAPAPKPATAAPPANPTPATAPTPKAGASSQPQTQATAGADAATPPVAPPAPGAQPPPAPPTEEQKAQAKTALEAGQAAYQAGDYATAVAHFQQSNALAPSPEAQFWLAMSLDLSGNPALAIQAFEALLADPAHTQLPESQVSAAQSRLSVLKQIPATFTLTVTPADAELLIDGVPQPGASPFSLKVPAGSHTMTIQREGYEPFEAGFTVKAAESLEDTIALTELPPPPKAAPVPLAEEPPPPPPPSKVPAYITLGVAGASAVVGTIFGIQALSAQSEFDDTPTAANADSVERNALIADMAFGVALTLGITGVVLLTSDDPGETAKAVPTKKLRPRTELAVAPYASPTGAGAAARLSF